ncbi:MAG TPA: hypothetical protein DCZ91_02370 [Lachnospiraceae bacterium]|nr:hypothetical protein [Lachnospiraceae bacterium]
MKRRKWKQVCGILTALCLMGSGLWDSGFYVGAQEVQENAGETVTGNVQETPDAAGQNSDAGAAAPGEEPGSGTAMPEEQTPGAGDATSGKEPGSGTAISEGQIPEAGAVIPGEEPGAAAAAPEERNAISEDIFNQDFEDTAEGALPQGWKFGNPGNSKASAGVQIIGGNHVLVLDQSEDNSGANYNPGLSCALPESYKKWCFRTALRLRRPGEYCICPAWRE